MKYVVRVDEYQIWNTWYLVEANSADEAEDIFYEEGGEIIDDEFDSIDDREVVSIEPYNENPVDSAIERLKQEGVV